MRTLCVWPVLLVACFRAPDRGSDPVARAADQDVATRDGNPRLRSEEHARATVNGKYADLAYRFRLDEDREEYGEFHDYGYYSNTSYKGHEDLPAGYWVYLAPYWYIWSRQVEQ